MSYFEKSGPIKGKKEIVYRHQGVTYWFSTVAHKDAFAKAPEKYKPAYGGFCAYAIGKTAEKVDVDPLTYKIYNGRLLLFYNKFFTNTLTLWNDNEEEFFIKAEKNWLDMVD